MRVKSMLCCNTSLKTSSSQMANDSGDGVGSETPLSRLERWDPDRLESGELDRLVLLQVGEGVLGSCCGVLDVSAFVEGRKVSGVMVAVELEPHSVPAGESSESKDSLAEVSGDSVHDDDDTGEDKLSSTWSVMLYALASLAKRTVLEAPIMTLRGMAAVLSCSQVVVG